MASDTKSVPERVCVIGGGVIGGFIAYRLAREGIGVTLLERDRLASGATGASAGNVQTLSDGFGSFAKDLGVESLALYRQYLPQIKEESGIDPLDQEVRYLYAAMNEDEAVRIRDETSHLKDEGMKVEWLDGAEAREIEPRLSPRLLGGMLHSDCVQMDGTRFVAALARAAQMNGAYVAGSEAVGLETEEGRVTGVRRRDGTVLECDSVVMAMGAWTGPALLDWLGVDLPIWPHALQKIHLLTASDPLRCAVRWGGVNIVSRRDGMTHVGSKQETFGFDAHPTEEGKAWLRERANTILPGLDSQVAEAWAGCAVHTPDAVPILGPIDKVEGVYAAAPSANGFLLAAILADIFVNSLLRGDEHYFAKELSPRRAVERHRSGVH